MPAPEAPVGDRPGIRILGPDVDADWPASLVAATGYARPPFAGGVIAYGPFLHSSGQTYPDIAEREPEPAAAVGMLEQARACLSNVDHVLRAAGCTREDVVKVVVYNTDMTRQSEVNRAYREYFGDHRPSRTHVGVTALAGPDLLVEIEVVAAVPAPASA
jgi:2-iminobutanoate/2-iminopropanoate deaminase